ncbi:sulfurtransferase TusA family protein [Halovulum dunhuangense]|uniref:Sulfurtransferase TusA family protein n=1 Tax=Halovulum dunhuangense TaxID=1505036 RepID=A0A849L6C0_9RHOB|nr:sulfurtransferase TusA family protein [Halovulum dunhuangense]NNU81936.1 sulfurtransferase TusA family protein [Halovulum dunhuangense]
MDWQDELDAAGLLCPLPVLRIRKRLSALRTGEVLRAVTDDPAALVDVPHFCTEQGHTLLEGREDGFPRQVWLIRKG